MYNEDNPECNLGIKIMNRECREHYGHSEFQSYFIFAVILAISIPIALFFVGEGIEERSIMHEKINVMTCPELNKLLSESTSSADIYRAEQNFKYECIDVRELVFDD